MPMEPVIRIEGRGPVSVKLQGLTPRQAENIQAFIENVQGGPELDSVPLSFSTPHPVGGSAVLVLTGTPRQFSSSARAVPAGNDELNNLFRKIESRLDNYMRTDYKIKCRGKMLELGGRTHIMGILNVTPDSFSDGGLYADPKSALEHARDMAAAGADILDIGGESTRPGALPLSEADELRRIIPLIEQLSAELTVPISVDTYKSAVAERALQAGASIVNDISGLRFSPDMAKVVADSGAAVIIMHIKGTPRDMQQNPVYSDVVAEVLSYLDEGIRIAEQAGVDREQVLIDPGIGFGKTLEHNLTILNRLDEFRTLGRPIVLGTSRKKFIGTVLNIPSPTSGLTGPRLR